MDAGSWLSSDLSGWLRGRWYARGAWWLLLVGLLLVAAPAVQSGGDFVDLAVVDGRVWFAGPSGVRSLDAATGRRLSMPRLVGAPYPLSVAVAGGAAWIASVENGYVWGTLSRIDERTGTVRVVWRRQGSSVQYVAAGAASVWALVGSRTSRRIARFSLSGRLLRVWRVAGAARMAADREGCWVITGRWLLKIDRAGRIHRVLNGVFDGVAVGAGAVWLPRETSVLRLDERTGGVRTLATGQLRLGGFQHDLAAGDGALWALRYESRTRSVLVRVDARSGLSTRSAGLPGIADALVVTPRALWVATVRAAAGGGYRIVRVDPHTLRRTLLIQIT